MNLHENKQLFADAILAASQAREDGGLGIKQVFLEKDYWITRSVKLLSEGRDAESAVFKGGTSISKAYGLGLTFPRISTSPSPGTQAERTTRRSL